MAEDRNKYLDKIIRIASKDVPGSLSLYTGFTKIKGISWTMSRVICKNLNLDKGRKIGSLSEEEIKKIEDFIKNPKAPKYILNRQKDFDTGEDGHLTGVNLELKKEADIKRLKKIKTYRGLRHSAKLPVRGQRTRANFRKNKQKGVGIKKKGK